MNLVEEAVLFTTPTIASVVIDAMSADGKAFVIDLELGTPYKCETGEWACPLSLQGLYERLPDIRGEDSFQTICLAIRLAQDLLTDFQDKGGKLLSEGENFRIEAYFVGISPPES